MYNRIVFKSYKNGLAGLGLIKEKMQEKDIRVLEIKKNGSKYVQKRKDLIINWGVHHGGKLAQLRALSVGAVPIAPFTQNREIALEWAREGSRVLCRTILNGHGGAGIVLSNNVDEIVDAPLYVKYIPKKREFRVHLVFSNDREHPYQFKVREKRRRANWQEQSEGFNKYIRNHDNGWVFCDEFREELPEGIDTVCANAVNALGLKLGAVDVGWHPDHGFIVYEVNTAPGCDNATAEWYAERFQEML